MFGQPWPDDGPTNCRRSGRSTADAYALATKHSTLPWPNLTRRQSDVGFLFNSTSDQPFPTLFRSRSSLEANVGLTSVCLWGDHNRISWSARARGQTTPPADLACRQTSEPRRSGILLKGIRKFVTTKSDKQSGVGPVHPSHQNTDISGISSTSPNFTTSSRQRNSFSFLPLERP